MAVHTGDRVIDGFIDLLLEHGEQAVTPKYRERVLDEAYWCAVTDFEWFWRHLGMVQIKGRGKEAGWQRACPDGMPRVDAVTGRDWGFQNQIAALMDDELDELFCMKPRQVGFSFLYANFIVWASAAEEQNIAVVANKLQTAERLVRRAINVHHRLPEWFRKRHQMRPGRPSVRRLEFVNGSMVEAYSGDPDATRSEAATWMLVDEIGEIERLDEFYASIEASAEHKLFFGTAKDNGIEMWCRECAAGDEVGLLVVPDAGAEDIRMPIMRGESGMSFVFIPDKVHPARTPEARAEQRKRYKGNLRNYDREHPETWEAAFVAQGTGYFDPTRIKEVALHLEEKADQRDRRGTLLAVEGGFHFVDDPYGNIVIHATVEEFEHLISKRRPFVAGVDVAGGKKQGDYHAASFVMIGEGVPEPGIEVPADAEIRSHIQIVTIHGHMDVDHYAELLGRVGIWLGDAMLAVETNGGFGESVLSTLRKMRYPNLYMRRVGGGKRLDGAELKREYGWYTSGGSKGSAYAETERLFRNGWIDIRSLDTVKEMPEIKHKPGGGIGTINDRKHDDLIDSLAIACAVIPFAREFRAWRSDKRFAIEAPKYGSMEWLIAEMDRQRDQRDNRLLGFENVAILKG